MKTAVVLFSGGQDSTTCLYWSLQRFDRVCAIGINYGQKHKVELKAAQQVLEQARLSYPDKTITHEVVELGRLLVGSSPLVNDTQDLGKYDTIEELPDGVEPTFVPGRNLLFLVLAANRAAKYGSTHLVTGVCQEDFGGYFDCRQKFIDAMALAISEGFYGTPNTFTIHTPLMDLTKKETVELANSLKGCMIGLAYSHTCYDGTIPPCGKCHACHLRARGFEQAGIRDPLLVRLGQ